MKIIFTLLFNFTLLLSFAQYSPVLKGKASFSRFLKSNTFVVLGEDEEVNEILMEAFKNTWTITPVEFIYEAEFHAYVNDPQKSFVYINNFKVKEEKKDVGAMALFNGGYNDTEFYLNSSLAYIAYDNWGIEKQITDFKHRIPAMVHQLQDVANLVYDNNISAKSADGITSNLNKLYNDRAGKLKNKTLLIDKLYTTTKIVSMEEFSKKYNYEYEVVSRETITEALENKSEAYAVLFSSYNLYKINEVVDCETYDIIYAEMEKPILYEDQELDKFDFNDAVQLSSAVKRGK